MILIPFFFQFLIDDVRHSRKMKALRHSRKITALSRSSEKLEERQTVCVCVCVFPLSIEAREA